MRTKTLLLFAICTCLSGTLQQSKQGETLPTAVYHSQTAQHALKVYIDPVTGEFLPPPVQQQQIDSPPSNSARLRYQRQATIKKYVLPDGATMLDLKEFYRPRR